MKTTVNPGSYLLLEGSFAIDPWMGVVVDMDTTDTVTLSDLLRRFVIVEDENAVVTTGRIMIAIHRYPRRRSFVPVVPWSPLEPKSSCPW